MKKKLGEILVSNGTVSGVDVNAALADQSAGEPSRLGDLLVATGKLSSVQLAQALGVERERGAEVGGGDVHGGLR